MKKYMAFFVIIAGLFGCKTTQPVRPQEFYDEKTGEYISNLNIPIHIEMKALEKMLNKQLSGVIYEDKDLNDGDDMMLRAEKKEDITLSLTEDTIRYRVPLAVFVKYDAGIAKVDADGEIAFDFKTVFNIGSDWNLKTQTVIDSYEWITKPKVRLGVLSLPVGSIANLLLNKFKYTITEAIDQQIAENFNMRQWVQTAWTQMFDPIEVSPEYRAWLMIQPQGMAITPLENKNGRIESTITVKTQPRIVIGAKPVTPLPAALPAFQYGQPEEGGFQMLVAAEIPYEEAESIAKASVVGERYDYGKRYIVVDDLELYGQGNKLVVNTKLSGSFNGSLYLTGEPSFNERRNAIDVKNLKYTIDSRNFLLKTAGWLLRSQFKNTLQENMDFLLDANLKEIHGQIQQQLTNYKIADNIYLTGKLSEFNLADAYLAPEAIRVEVVLKGDVVVDLKELKVE